MSFLFRFCLLWMFPLISKSVPQETCKGVLKSSPFCDQTLSFEKRVEFLVNNCNLTIKEKIDFLDYVSPGVERLSIGPFNWGCEGLHGLCGNAQQCPYGSKITSYPQVINLGRTFDMKNVFLMASQIGDEARALSNAGRISLSFWAPNLNIFRDPRWGRGQETPGEDPYLTSEYGKNFIRGMMEGVDPDPRYVKTLPGVKHYTAYDLENWGGTDRFHFDAIISMQDMEETIQPPFKTAVEEANALQIMCSFNSVNGVPACGDKFVLQELLRDKYKFEGIVTSDCGGVESISNSHHFVDTLEEAIQLALRSGTEVNCGTAYRNSMESAYDKRLISEEDINKGIARTLMLRMKTGEFDDWKDQPYRKIDVGVVGSKEHTDLSYLLAKESMVLLKNDGGTLPLKKEEIKSIALIGPHFNSTIAMMGNYNDKNGGVFLISPLMALQKRVDVVKYSKGCDIVSQDKSHFKEAKAISGETDATVLVMGSSYLDEDHQEHEGCDRNSLVYPGVQLDLMKEIVEVSKGPVILVKIHAGPLDCAWEKNEERVKGIIDAGYPSQSGGEAICDVLFGDYNPSGRLTVTEYPAAYVDNCDMKEMAMRPSEKCKDGRTYKFYTGEPHYEFGYGLSYTTFEYKWFDDDEIRKNIDLRTVAEQHFKVNVTNTGNVQGDVVVLAFITNTFLKDAPLKELFGFERISLNPGETKQVSFVCSERMFENVNSIGERNIFPGKYLLQIGDIKRVIFLV